MLGRQAPPYPCSRHLCCEFCNVLQCVAVSCSMLQCIHIPSPEMTAVSVALRSQPRVISHSESEPELPKFYSESDSEWSFIPEIVFCLRRSPNGVLRMASATGSANSATQWQAPNDGRRQHMLALLVAIQF